MTRKTRSAATIAARRNLYRYKASNVRSAMGRRAPGLPRPSIDELEAWLRSQPLHCAYSGEELDIENLTVDHMRPLDRGGSHAVQNLCLASSKSNREKGCLTASEFHELLALMHGWPDKGAGLLKRLRAAGTMFR